MSLKRCRCKRIIGAHNRYNRNKIHTEYCSRFCYESIQRNNRITKNAVLDCDCYWCGSHMTLSYAYTEANARYCSKDCYNQLGKHKNGIRDILMLNALYERGPLSLEELTRIAAKGVARASGVKSVVAIMRPWMVRDGVVREGAYYEYVSVERPGNWIKRFSKKS